MDSPLTSCEIKAKYEEGCEHHCSALLKEYKKCQKRINSYDEWDHKDLLVEAEWKQMKTKDKNNKPIAKEILVQQLSEAAHCTPQFFDFKHCIDHCTAPKLFKDLK